MTIDEMLNSDGFGGACYECPHAARDEDVNFRGCECPDDKLCPRIPLYDCPDALGA